MLRPSYQKENWPIAYHRLELCADVIVSAAARRSISVGGGGAPPGPKKTGGGGGRRGGAKKVFSKIQEKLSFYPQNFLRNFFIHQSFEVCRWPMLAGSESDLQIMMHRLNMVSVNYNMKINTNKKSP